MQRVIKFALCALVCCGLVGCTYDDLQPSMSIVDSVSNSVVKIEYLAPGETEWKFTGTGWCVAPEGIVTARHVLETPAGYEFRVRLWNGEGWGCDTLPVQAITKSSKRDLAFGYVPGLMCKPLSLAGVSPRRTERVWGLGCHWYGGLFFLPGQVIGHVPEATESAGDFVTDQHVSNGCSGGPVLQKIDGEWRIVGVIVGLSVRNGVVFPQGWIEPVEALLEFLIELDVEFTL